MDIKKFGFTAMVAIVSTLATLATIKFFYNDQPLSFEQKQAANFAQVSYAPSVNAPVGFDFRYAAKMTTQGVVHIKTTYAPRQTSRNQYDPFKDFFGDQSNPFGQGQAQESSGSGVIISDDGYIVTNNHVIERGDKIQVILSNKKSYEAKVIGTDPSTDIALIKIEESNMPFIRFGNSDSVEVGQWAVAVGNPFNLESTVTAGIVSAKGRNINIIGSRNGGANDAVESFIQTDAAVNPGNSGGALVNTKGELIGINSAIATPTGSFAGYSFAVPVNIVSKVVNDLMKYGVVQRGYLGVQIATVTDELAHDKKLSDVNGVYVDSVNEGSAAELAGLKSGDVITKINGITVNTSPELQEQVSRFHPGDKISVTYMRDGKEKVSDATLKNKEGNTSVVKKEETSMVEALGAEFSDLSLSEKKQMGITGGVKIVKLQDGALSKNVRIREGFVITKIDNKQVADLSALKQVLINKKGYIAIEGRYPNDPTQYFYSFGLDN
ncbi:MAG: Do family serine endopeptidase [Chitinophagales bacterium]|nr:Do family serine endopeptidase [Chitinophagales bacterium]